jgi:ubiquinone/menaquinone biosynthesis C-methylase UbiE
MLSRIRRFGFCLLYNECAFIYDFVSRSVSLGRWHCWQRSVMKYLPEPAAGVVFELAHGSGDLQVDLAKAGYCAMGLDLSRSMGRQTKRKLTKNGCGARLMRGDALHLPLRTNSIAALVCTFPTAFIIQPRCLAEIARVLQPGGHAVIVLSARLTGGGALTFAIRSLYQLTGQSYDRIADDEICELFYSPGLMVEAGIACANGSEAQIVILRKARLASQWPDENSLELAQEA